MRGPYRGKEFSHVLACISCTRAVFAGVLGWAFAVGIYYRSAACTLIVRRPVMTGTADHPYVLRLPVGLYRTRAADLTCWFSEEELRTAVRTAKPLGVGRYLPARDEALQLPIPPGAWVECRVAEREP